MHLDSTEYNPQDKAKELVDEIARHDYRLGTALFCMLSIITNPAKSEFAEDFAHFALERAFIYTPEFKAAVKTHAGYGEPEVNK